MSDWDHEGVRDVDWLSGAAMLLNGEALARTGPFDERYFFEIEDVDLCRRMHAAGYRVVYLPEATVTHRIGASSRTLPNRVILARHAGMWRYYRRYLRGSLALDAVTGAAIAARCGVLLARANGVRAMRRLRARGRLSPPEGGSETRPYGVPHV
jgi:GT2 family glycosyltransferase